MTFKVPEIFRLKKGPLASDERHGNNGAFIFDSPFFYAKKDYVLRAIASDGNGWEHVSVSLENRCPTWEEMCFVKSLFWHDEDCVMQLHPPKSEWINNHNYCLHLWRPVGQSIPRPPSIMVGVK